MKANKLFLLAMGLVAVGCSDNQLEEPTLAPDVQGEPVEVVINATIAPASRAESSLNDYDTKDGVATTIITKFVENDEIGVYLNWATNDGAYGFTHENVKFTAQGLNAEKSAMVFKPEEQTMLLAAGNHAYAYYPYSATNTDFEGVTRSANLGGWDGYHHFHIDIRQAQGEVVTSENAGLYFDGFSNYAYMISKEKLMKKEGNTVSADLEFCHAFAYATLVINNAYDKDLTLEKAEVTFFDKAGKEIPIVGDFGVKLDDEAEGDAVVATTGGVTEATVELVPAHTGEGAVSEGAETIDLKLAAEKTTKLVAAIAPYTNEEGLGGAKIVIYTKEGYVFAINKDYSTREEPLLLPQSTNVRFGATLDASTLSSVVTSNEIAEFMLRQDKEEIVLDLANDIELSINSTPEDFWGGALANGECTKLITINGNGYNLVFNLEKDATHNDVNMCDASTKLVINDATIIAQTETVNGDWRYHYVAFHCDNLELNNVRAAAGLVLRANATLNDVIFFGPDFDNEDGSGNYALWLMPIEHGHEKQVVNMDGCLFRANGNDRAIKIDGGNHHDEIKGTGVAVPVELNVTNTVFKTAKKAAVVVNTLSGANITFGEGVDISDCTGDAVNHVWIDSRNFETQQDEVKDGTTNYFKYGEGIQVNGGNWKFEEAKWSVKEDGTAEATNGTGLQHAIKYGLNDIKLVYAAGQGQRNFNLGNSLIPTESREITITADEAANLSVQASTNMGGNKLTLENVTLKGNTGDVNGLIAESLVCKNVKVSYPDGLELRTASATFEDCQFVIEKEGAYVNTNLAEKVSFDRCVFNTQGSAILVKNPENAAEVSVMNSFFNAAKQYLPVVAETAITGMKAAAIEIDNAADEAGVAHIVKTGNNSLSTMGNFSGEWRIRNYVEVDGGVTVNGVAYENLYLDGKLIYKPAGSDEWHVAL